MIYVRPEIKRGLFRLFSLILIIGLVTSPLTSTRAENSLVGDPGKTWAIPNDAERGMHVQVFIDSFPLETTSWLIDPNLVSKKFVDPTCSSVNDLRCESNSLQYRSVLPACGELSSVYCIEQIGVINSAGLSAEGTFKRYFPNKSLNEFQSSEALNLPFGGASSIYNIPSAAHPGGTDYYISVVTEGMVSKNYRASLNRFSIRIYPVKMEQIPTSGSFEPGWSEEKEGTNGHVIGQWRQANFGFGNDSKTCISRVVKEGLCAQTYAFPGNTKFFVKLRMQELPIGWLHGRIFRPDIKIEKQQDFYSVFVSAYPIAVPAVYKMYRYPEMPEVLKSAYDFNTGDYKPEAINAPPFDPTAPGGCGRTACTLDPLTRNKIIAPAPSSKYGIEQLKLWLPFVNDQASASIGTWSVRTLEPNELIGAEKCFTRNEPGILGIVTTNATQYSAGPPNFNSSSGTLEYNVAAPHFDTAKNEFSGTYDLAIKSEVARCVYGFTEAPIRATISIVKDGESSKVATELVNENDGWLYLSATGFTYSSPTIQ
ncbi:MAG: hypothetical protein ACKN92_06810, partial [Candidatus Nanopelagicaceae bacterium]